MRQASSWRWLVRQGLGLGFMGWGFGNMCAVFCVVVQKLVLPRATVQTGIPFYEAGFHSAIVGETVRVCVLPHFLWLPSLLVLWCGNRV